VLKSVLQSGFGDLVQVYLAPKLFGGDGLSPIAAMQIATPDNAILLTPPEITTLGEDVLLTYRRKGGETPCLPES
jgi:diaminohydroxyphosphoribosylaminopyrimidine deaminase/5-amino-6-(5-phosphoribosylamino)uracil reductase